MSITNVMPTIAVVDLTVSSAWYARLWGREADRSPMDGLLEWDLTSSSGIQVWTDAEKAGSTMATIGTDDLPALVAELAERGLKPASEQEADYVNIAIYHDPDRNQIVFAQPR